MIENKKNRDFDKLFWPVFIIGSVLLLILSYFKIIPISITEDLGFITGALTVWWTVKENIWNWPVGIANDIFFIILFLKVRLYADTFLQVIYIILAFWGWYWWLHGGKNKTELKISSIRLKEIIILSCITIISTYLMNIYLISINDTKPFWDALTTVLSLVAQYMLTVKYLENWYVWITADIIYIALYFSTNLYLTGILYIIFMVMCVEGLREWRRTKDQYQPEIDSVNRVLQSKPAIIPEVVK
jgi:nicotinamide mononucleotide transporter